MDKIKVLFISDHPLVPSGVGTQSKYLIEGLLETGRYKFVCLGGAIEHPDYSPQKIAPEKYGDDWIVRPVKGYGDKNVIREALIVEKPDVLFFFTDPRFFTWLWEIEDEVRSVCPMVYWHVWDNDPSPEFNKIFYDSTDHVAALSLKTYGLLQDLGCDNDRISYIPHALDKNLFKPLSEEENIEFKNKNFGKLAESDFIIFWNNRNARRKQTGDVIAAFELFLRKHVNTKAALMMHTNPRDPEGQNVFAVAKKYGVLDKMIISDGRVLANELNSIYNTVDCTLNISSNEGFGLGTLESLYAGTPIVLHMTGGLQFQIGDWWFDQIDIKNQDSMTKIAKKKWKDKSCNWWGAPVFSASRSCTGSQNIPYIYDDRVLHEDVVIALSHVYKMGRKKRRELGLKAREWALETFSLEKMIKQWDDIIMETIAHHNDSVSNRYRIEAL